MRNLLNEYCKENDVTLLTADGFDDAIIGVIYTSDCNGHVVYDKEKMKQTLMTGDDMTEDEALEYLEYNVYGAYMGEHTPLYMDTF